MLDSPEVTDAEDDALLRELRQLETDFPELIIPDSPPQRVGGRPTTLFAPVEHRVRGARVTNSVSKSTSFVVVGANPGATKHDKALALGIETVDEREFLRRLGERRTVH